MDSKIIFTETAKNDLNGIMEYITIKLCNYTAANNLFNNIIKSLDTIALYPLSYPLVENDYIRNKYTRKVVINNYNLYYVVEDNIIKIIRIIYNKRDLSEIINNLN